MRDRAFDAEGYPGLGPKEDCDGAIWASGALNWRKRIIGRGEIVRPGDSEGRDYYVSR